MFAHPRKSPSKRERLSNALGQEIAQSRTLVREGDEVALLAPRTGS